MYCHIKLQIFKKYFFFIYNKIIRNLYILSYIYYYFIYIIYIFLLDYLNNRF